MASKHCRTCNREFEPKSGAHRYCSTECRASRKPKPTCFTCSAPLRGKGRRYCGPMCWPEQSRRYLELHRATKQDKPSPLCVICNVALDSDRKLCGHKHCQSEWKKRRNGVRQCARCGADFMAASKNTKHCSLKCSQAQFAHAEYANETERQTAKTHRRRAKMLNAFVERVVPSTVYERDNWTCQLCNEPVDRTLHGWDRMAATLDHVVPLTLGGLHTYANVQLAHRACNSTKSNHYAGQLPLPI